MSASWLFPLTLASDGRPVPLRDAPRAARPFPRRKSILYAIICILWLSFGIVGRDPWKPQETLLTGVIAAQVRGEAQPPALAAHDSGAPQLYTALAAQTAALMAGYLPLHEGARLLNIFLLLGGFAALWLAGKRLYGIRTAWLALLLVVCCLGFMVRAHILTPQIAAFAGVALALLGAAILATKQNPISQALLSGCLIGSGAALALLSAQMAAAALALLFLAVARREQIAVYAVCCAFVLPVLLHILLAHGAASFAPSLNFSSPAEAAVAAGDTLRVAAWSLLPLLPLAAYGLWYNRQQKLPPLLRVCLLAVAGGFAAFFVSGNNEEDYYLLLPPLALVAAHLLLKTPDDTANVMDAFAILIIGICAAGGLWLAWLGVNWPLGPISEWMNSALPGFSAPPAGGGKVAFAAALTAGWIVLLLNFGRSNERAVVNWSCGITLVWALFNLLLVGYVDSGKSYRQPAQQLAELIQGRCIAAPDDRHWQAQLFYFGMALGGSDCPYFLSRQPDGAIARIRRNAGEKGYHLHPRQR